MIALLDFSLRLHIASYAPELTLVFRDLFKVQHKIVCPFHKNSIIYINKPCKICGFVKRLSDNELKEYGNEFYNMMIKRRKKNKQRRISKIILSYDPV